MIQPVTVDPTPSPDSPSLVGRAWVASFFWSQLRRTALLWLLLGGLGAAALAASLARHHMLQSRTATLQAQLDEAQRTLQQRQQALALVQAAQPAFGRWRTQGIILPSDPELVLAQLVDRLAVLQSHPAWGQRVLVDLSSAQPWVASAATSAGASPDRAGSAVQSNPGSKPATSSLAWRFPGTIRFEKKLHEEDIAAVWAWLGSLSMGWPVLKSCQFELAQAASTSGSEVSSSGASSPAATAAAPSVQGQCEFDLYYLRGD